ncbi:hypothetical protein [Xylophilus sp. Leaf220]|uniref:DUF7668 domain-containing protein n=1 Tax=Xylophilus sp. Leaf220 TaxID=1735686 RepID=UPI0006F27AF7|nr:hypothetical protein [Xylophilus sp. Leaf220]KQM79803.1 hypothetical protein ASE76_00945 [Xylophilus sp. Leaf220]
MSASISPEVLPVKDEDYPRAVPTAWRPLLTDVVRCLVAGDYGLIAGGAGVDPLPPDVRADIRDAIESYGTLLVELPERAWERATAQWYSNHWVVCVDLWSDTGPTELVLAGRIVETDTGPKFTVYLVHIP